MAAAAAIAATATAAAAAIAATATAATAAAVGSTTVTASAPPTPLLRRLTDLDTSLSLHIHSLSQPVPHLLLKALEISGDGRFWFPIPLALLPLTSSQRPLLLALLAGLLLDILLIGLLKHLVRRSRPVYNKGMGLTFSVDHWSFPSGHSSRVFFIACWMRDWYGGEKREVVVPVIFGWAAATSVSRVLLGRHFVMDVCAGASLGVVVALIVFYFFQTYGLL